MREDILNIQQVIARFATSFDVKDWDGLQACLTESVFTDYSDLRGTPPETITAADYVRLRREALDALKLHHLASNYETHFPDSGSATCRASMVVWRQSEAEEFITHCVYNFQLIKLNGDWKISGITQKVLWSDGNSSIHKVAK
ncbi:MAG: nuclear transport factor 2 family protein [Anaerolineales bacterium]|nr:MAG: nuclear transport factor 2 family protein [Anaerolineales bacterium]